MSKFCKVATNSRFQKYSEKSHYQYSPIKSAHSMSLLPFPKEISEILKYFSGITLIAQFTIKEKNISINKQNINKIMKKLKSNKLI